MHIDSIRLMYHTFQQCRYSLPDTPRYLGVLTETLELVTHQRSFVVALSRASFVLLPEEQWSDIRRFWWTAHTQQQRFLSADAALFALIKVGTAELQRLWHADQPAVVRAVGYALHPLPALLCGPERFDRELYSHCFRIVGRYWHDLSFAMQHHMCTVLNMTIEEGQRFLMQQPESWD